MAAEHKDHQPPLFTLSKIPGLSTTHDKRIIGWVGAPTLPDTSLPVEDHDVRAPGPLRNTAPHRIKPAGEKDLDLPDTEPILPSHYSANKYD